MQTQTVVFPTSRAIRHELLILQKSTIFLPNFITMSEFIERVCLVEGFKKIDNDTRVLLLLEASDFKEFEALQIERNFFTFTQNSTYVFTLFTELSGEKVELQELELADTYGDYEEHISILKALHGRYENLCLKRKIFDPIFLPKWYEFNAEYVKSLGEIKLIVEGYLTAFELEILQKCAEVAKVKIELTTTQFNKKVRERFASLGFMLERDHKYLLDLNRLEILEQDDSSENKNVECYSFSEHILQVAFVKQKVYEYIKSGLKCEEIVVILPNESFAPLLKLYDKEGNFNFAMGQKFTHSEAYGHLNAVCEYIETPSVQNGARLKRYKSAFYEVLYPLYYKSMDEIDFSELMQAHLICLHNKAEKKIIEEELYSFVKLKNIYSELNLKSTLHLFMQRLSGRALDDIGGGKITVMGVLESRHVDYKGVIIVDFNDSNVPKRSEKDLFLNSDIRALANLPTQNDRENLQKHYYALLMNRAKHVSISYVKSSSTIPSRFLTELGIKAKEAEDELSYAAILHKAHSQEKDVQDEPIVLDYDFSHVRLSATSLKTFLDCRRKYYYKYIMHIKSHEMPQDFPTEHQIGLDLHEALKNVYMKKMAFSDTKELHSEIYNELERISGASSLEVYQLKLWNRKLTSFVENEIGRFTEGTKVFECEKELTCNYAGMELTGQIDRIDVQENGLYVLDYKSGKYPLYTAKTLEKATDFQLEFYYLLASTLGKVAGCGYYDLSSGKVVDETFLHEKLELLQTHLNELQEQKSFDFCKTEDESKCTFCEFKTLCGRD
ncbi:MAG: PD-(D/E)XK nuclease family protein [Thiovulaceae bacterium]|nr:PD-(D/E)XK nuclease family protein [Sulfurimonadaceae bacterium]